MVGGGRAEGRRADWAGSEVRGRRRWRQEEEEMRGRLCADRWQVGNSMRLDVSRGGGGGAIG